MLNNNINPIAVSIMIVEDEPSSSLMLKSMLSKSGYTVLDIVETGGTLRENGLEVDEKIMDIGSRLICNKVALKTKRDEIEEIVQLLEELRD